MRKASFRKNVVEKEWEILYRNEYGEETAVVVKGETETVALGKIPKGMEIIGIEERKKEI